MTEDEIIRDFDTKIRELTEERDKYISNLGVKDLVNSVPELKGIEIGKKVGINEWTGPSIMGILDSVTYDRQHNYYVLKFFECIVISGGTTDDGVRIVDGFGGYRFTVVPYYHSHYELIDDKEFESQLNQKRNKITEKLKRYNEISK